MCKIGKIVEREMKHANDDFIFHLIFIVEKFSNDREIRSVQRARQG